MPLIDDKDKGPAKGDVLNGAVSWTRDLMWMLHRKIQQESILLETIEQLGGANPLQVREDEQRMQSELFDAIQRNGVGNFGYSRGAGSGLWVPNVTDHAGNPLESSSGMGGQQGFAGAGTSGDATNLAASFGHEHINGGIGHGQEQQQQQFWSYSGQGDPLDDFKEEDEFDMQM